MQYPLIDMQLEFHLLDGEFCCACIITDEFPLCWQPIVMFAGTFSMIIFVILCIFTLFRMKSKISIYDTGKYYLIFGLLTDLPNLLPILPISLGFITDGFAISTCFYQMGYSLLLPNMLSNIFSLLSSSSDHFFTVLENFLSINSEETIVQMDPSEIFFTLSNLCLQGRFLIMSDCLEH